MQTMGDLLLHLVRTEARTLFFLAKHSINQTHWKMSDVPRFSIFSVLRPLIFASDPPRCLCERPPVKTKEKSATPTIQTPKSYYGRNKGLKSYPHNTRSKRPSTDLKGLVSIKGLESDPQRTLVHVTNDRSPIIRPSREVHFPQDLIPIYGWFKRFSLKIRLI